MGCVDCCYQYHAAQQEEVRDNEKEKGEQP